MRLPYFLKQLFISSATEIAKAKRSELPNGFDASSGRWHPAKGAWRNEKTDEEWLRPSPAPPPEEDRWGTDGYYAWNNYQEVARDSKGNTIRVSLGNEGYTVTSNKNEHLGYGRITGHDHGSNHLHGFHTGETPYREKSDSWVFSDAPYSGTLGEVIVPGPLPEKLQKLKAKQERDPQ